MFSKILIANRGEIACRVMQTARQLGVRTVAVYSDADATAKHVAMADEAVHIGPAPVAESYLKGDRIIAAALATGAQAIHPGYGFLSENPDFVGAVEAAGLTFIGPSARAIRAMGLKDAAKALMEEAGVPVVPGYHGAEQDPAFLAAEADKIGYPVLIKARAGGGGKGMRKVDDPAQFRAALEGAQREGQASFGDAAVLIEKWITTPRHIEIQVFGDGTNAIHLGERDCSLQRRHQKVIEEAPAPGMTSEMREVMGAAAVRAADAIGYSGAGTIEFIVDGSNGLDPEKFWFMEMNTRLQVEHPVTEAITGIDLVEWQLRVASGEPLPATQSEITLTGHAFEARLYAEDATKGFLPATGTLTALRFPNGTRADSGVRAGDAITPHYDPMIAKLIVHGASRDIALGQLRTALEDTIVAGSVTNLPFLVALTRHAGFAAGDMDTGLIERDQDELTRVGTPSIELQALAAVLALELLPSQPLQGFTLWTKLAQRVELDCGSIDVTVASPGCYECRTSDEQVVLKDVALEGCAVHVNGRRLLYAQSGPVVTLFEGAVGHVFERLDPLTAAVEATGGGDRLVAPMPGLVKLVNAQAGAHVTQGEALIVMEAMKMEHTLTAPRDGIVAELAVKQGQQVADGDVMLALEPLADA
ncbi:acetyl/propionyl/methylcrotonyl-CoA carboxylase subunit alpha [Pontivivens insulae]|uniref:Acetyl-/propionyl-coenzyme A carboxylase alpha chain n=1 Tax=Pontivivens insulae TaxID=1639689 RepID=A0A2R8AEJ1_9RHOB|nr:acetyl/propionyl/methylcrotonyl-CoA carboxylase subunit alpha [Pontivivens insulae]RED11885.1 3-methylcrotonoyl-CoA carboxylase alpha subunit [Pontivivens insulae]SPF30642.1 Acetyl-/propionyl-coenzyme A carboxylase alpha chain [Pontivivens insulae]